MAQESGRTDLQYLGHMEHDIILEAPAGETTIRVMHPGPRRSARTLLPSGFSWMKWLKSSLPPYNLVRNVHVIQAGCTQDQTPFMRKKRLSAHLGGWIIEFSVGDRGEVTRFRSEFIPFYDRDFHQWEYKW